MQLLATTIALGLLLVGMIHADTIGTCYDGSWDCTSKDGRTINGSLGTNAHIGCKSFYSYVHINAICETADCSNKDCSTNNGQGFEGQQVCSRAECAPLATSTDPSLFDAAVLR